MKSNIPVEKRTLDVFAQTIQQEFNFAADLSATEAAKKAEQALCKDQTFDRKALRQALRTKLKSVMEEQGMAEAADPEKIANFLDVILATHPELLWEAQKKARAAHMEIQEAEELPTEITSTEPLQKSPRNVYERMPVGLNGWEREFADLLDHDPHRLVNWWHRNPPDKPWSVNVLMPSGKGFYPDFIIGIEGRATEDGALLADPKERFETSQEAPKVLAEHQVYGRVMILAKDGVRWMTVGYDEKMKKPVPVREFHLVDTPAFGTAGVQTGVAGRTALATLDRTTKPMTAAPAISPLAAPGGILVHSMVRLHRAIAGEGLRAGATGTVVHVYEGGTAYEVEFLEGRSRPCLVTLNAMDLEVIADA